MAENYYYYRCRTTSKVGRRLHAFHVRLLHAERAADEFAAHCGATSFIQQPESMAGGIEYFEFSEAPDKKIWRKALTSKEGIDEYELNCDITHDFLISREPFGEIPGDKWNIFYLRKQHRWEEVRLLRSMSQWRESALREGLADETVSDETLKNVLKDCYFSPFLRFNVPDVKGHFTQKQRRAVRLEKARMRLPVVTQEELFSILELRIEDAEKPAIYIDPSTALSPASSSVSFSVSVPEARCSKRKTVETDGKKKSPRRFVMETPIYFFCEDWVYVRTQMPSESADFQLTDRATFMELRRYALENSTSR